MPLWISIPLVVVLWVVAGISAAVGLGRRGYRAGWWYLIGAVLGPFFLPIALERGRREDRVVERTPRTGGADVPGTVTAVVGVDGSPESDRCVHDAARLFVGKQARVVLVTAVDPDVAEFPGDELSRWRGLLAGPVAGR